MVPRWFNKEKLCPQSIQRSLILHWVVSSPTMSSDVTMVIIIWSVSINNLLTKGVLLIICLVAQILMTRDVSICTDITNRQPQMLVSTKSPLINSVLRVRPLPQRTRGPLAADGNEEDAPTASWASSPFWLGICLRYPGWRGEMPSRSERVSSKTLPLPHMQAFIPQHYPSGGGVPGTMQRERIWVRERAIPVQTGFHTIKSHRPHFWSHDHHINQNWVSLLRCSAVSNSLRPHGL